MALTALIGPASKLLGKFIKDKDKQMQLAHDLSTICLLYTSPSPRDVEESRMPSSA